MSINRALPRDDNVIRTVENNRDFTENMSLCRMNVCRQFTDTGMFLLKPAAATGNTTKVWESLRKFGQRIFLFFFF
jgi:hypothetical protein